MFKFYILRQKFGSNLKKQVLYLILIKRKIDGKAANISQVFRKCKSYSNMTTTLEEKLTIKGIDFISKNILLVNLGNGRALFVTLSKVVGLDTLTEEQRKNFEIIDGNYLSFLSISEIYSINDLAGF